MSGSAGGEPALLSAVRAGDTTRVQCLLRQGGDPGVLEDAFGLATRTYAGGLAQLLLRYGADPGRCDPDDLLPLRDAVAPGSPALADALLHPGNGRRYPAPELREMRDLARRLHDAGAEAELRRRTGSRDPVVRTRVQDDEYHGVGAFTLGATTVRDGHGAVLTRLEELLGVRTSFAELMGRAVAHDQDHAAWGTATLLLAGRRDQEVWTAAAALRRDADPSHRLFGAEVLRLTHLLDDRDEDVFGGPALELFTAWSAEEADPAVLTEVLTALGDHADPRADAALLPHAGHPDPRVRGAVARGLGSWSRSAASSADVRGVLLVLMTDVDPRVRRDACLTVARGGDRAPVLADAMAALLDDADRQVRLAAVQGLAQHDDGRCVAAARRLGPPHPASPDEEHALDAAWRYERRRDGR
ncbi:HEAT repeat domain-containing protein [Streptomyces sp. NPDC031705]|uniref:HEAT repeat domain-containing protein n=1 Tax=Streptomyces sp. NPDC031705 TaxID=3155729 RepID=UPI00340BFF56